LIVGGEAVEPKKQKKVSLTIDLENAGGDVERLD